jgi:hypothetical protein
MTDDETYKINKDLAWALVHGINEKLDSPDTTNAQGSYLLGMLRVWECVISNGESIPSLETDKK